jgi:hypothetical protein
VIYHRTIFPRPAPTLAKPPRDHTPPDGFALTTSQKMNILPAFQLVCDKCDALGIMLDYPDDAPSSTLIKCRHCGGPRGSLGDLRSLAQSDRRDIFEFE